MKNSKLNTHVLMLAALMVGSGSTLAGTFQSITIDGNFSDWAGVPVLDADPADNSGFVDLANIQVANDSVNLYIRATYHTALAQSTYIALDIDQNTATGFDVFGLGLIGSEAGWQNDFAFAQTTGVFNSGALAGDYFGGGHALMSPFGDSSSREWAISLSSTFATGGAPVFPDGSFNILLWTDAGAGDVSAPIAYTLAPVPEPTTLALLGIGGVCAFVMSVRRRSVADIR